ncbi:hypothetical protein [Actinacidiphila acididurans]|uniref:Uncharacterized protein n=1 Tax=Actinacidiphila acididurans TaxID=2784346 RepID=A0ABS2U790_9ACTN|nr:hypothetical protein [Actinacidiphila acididurans]MBM9510380.1 hypothetical protein [Actinacidiphila acididurans]
MASSRMKKITVAGAAIAAVGGLTFAASANAAGRDVRDGSAGPASSVSAPVRPAASSHAADAARTAHNLAAAKAARAAQAARAAAAGRAESDAKVVQSIAHGVVDGVNWSVTLEYYPTLPADFGWKPVPGTDQPEPKALLCQRMVIGGVLIDHQGGPWADCQPLSGPHDPQGSGEEGLWGFQDKGTSGTRLFVSNPEATVASGVVTLTDGTRLEAPAVSVRGTSYRAWAVAIPDGHTIASVDQYDAHHHLVSHETEWS